MYVLIVTNLNSVSTMRYSFSVIVRFHRISKLFHIIIVSFSCFHFLRPRWEEAHRAVPCPRFQNCEKPASMHPDPNSRAVGKNRNPQSGKRFSAFGVPVVPNGTSRGLAISMSIELRSGSSESARQDRQGCILEKQRWRQKPFSISTTSAIFCNPRRGSEARHSG